MAADPQAGAATPENVYYVATGPLLSAAADALGDAGAALDEAARALRRVAALDQGTVAGPDAAPKLRGKKLLEVIDGWLADNSKPGSWQKPSPVHYRDLYAMLERYGYRVGGRDPLATFLTALSRSQRFRPVGRRSGLYQLAA